MNSTSELACSHRHYATVEQALRYIQSHQLQQPSLSEIANHCSMSEYHFQKVFSHWAGVTPKRFLQCLTREQCRQRLLRGDSLLDSSLGAGLSGSGRLHDLLVTLEAVTPGDIKSGGKHLLFRYGLHPCPFGLCFIACTERGIHQLAFINAEQLASTLLALAEQWPLAELIEDPPYTAQLVARIFSRKHTANAAPESPLKLWLAGSPFQFKVWEALLQVPAGQLCSYGDLATVIGQPGAARAVGSAVGKNAVAYLIPCHRVIQRMGIIGHYRWGDIRKQALLGWEANRDDETTISA